MDALELKLDGKERSGLVDWIQLRLINRICLYLEREEIQFARIRFEKTVDDLL